MEVKPIVHIQSGKIHLDGSLIIKSIDMDILPGEFCYLHGPSGAGKTTLMNALMGIGHLSGDHFEIMGRDLTNISPNELSLYRRELGIISPSFELLEKMTVSENLDLILQATGWKGQAERIKKIKLVLSTLGLHTKTDESVSTLSLGERQKLKVARALLNQPKLILADDPTSVLDKAGKNAFLDLIIQAASQTSCAVLWATHDDDLIHDFPARTFKCISRVIK